MKIHLLSGSSNGRVLCWRIRSDLSNQGPKHQFQFVDPTFQRSILARCQKSEVPAQQKEVVEFACRSKGQMQKVSQLDSPSPTAPFRNIGRNGIRGASHLARKSVSFLLGKTESRSVYTEGHRMAFLPNQKSAKILHRLNSFLSAFSSFTYNLIIITYNSSAGVFQCS